MGEVMSFEQYNCRSFAQVWDESEGELSERPACLRMDGIFSLAWRPYFGWGTDGLAQFRRRVASYDVLVPAKNFGTLGAIAIN